MNLFASFILRALSVLIKDALFDATKKPSHWSTTVNNEVRIMKRLHTSYYRRRIIHFVLFLHGNSVCWSVCILYKKDFYILAEEEK